MHMNRKSIGPRAYENWKALISGAPGRPMWEVPLYSDGFIGGDLLLGPFHFLNANVMQKSAATYKQGPADSTIPCLFLRIFDHLPAEEPPPEMSKTDVQGYHGGGVLDEITALVSLCLGARLKPGVISRIWHRNGDPMGRPIGWEAHKTPLLVNAQRGLHILP